jgi:hypothetical protein
MKKSAGSYTLVRRTPRSGASERPALIRALKRQSSHLARQFEKLKPPMQQAIASELLRAPTRKGAPLTVSKGGARLLRGMTDNQQAIKVGLLDLGAWLPGLPDVAAALNRVQKKLLFVEIQAPVPSGLLLTKEGLLTWAKDAGLKLTAARKAEVSKNILADAFFRAGRDIRKAMGLDYLVGITAPMVAGSSEGKLYWNHFSSYEGPIVVVSTAEMRRYATLAKRPFEAAVAGLVVASLLGAMNPRLDFHPDRGCIFDYHGDRESIVTTLRNPVLEDTCLERIKPALRETASQLVAALAAWKA